ncbi:MAG: hypothetical protein AAFQ38_17660 [Pseudomonadota bacterium]
MRGENISHLYDQFTSVCNRPSMIYPKPCPSKSLDTLADELGDIRREMRELKAKSDILRRAIIEARPNGAVTGERFEPVILESQRRTFNHSALPNHIRTNERYWHTAQQATVVTKPVQAPAQAILPLPVAAAPVEEEFDVLEPF